MMGTFLGAPDDKDFSVLGSTLLKSSYLGGIQLWCRDHGFQPYMPTHEPERF